MKSVFRPHRFESSALPLRTANTAPATQRLHAALQGIARWSTISLGLAMTLVG